MEDRSTVRAILERLEDEIVEAAEGYAEIAQRQHRERRADSAQDDTAQRRIWSRGRSGDVHDEGATHRRDRGRDGDGAILRRSRRDEERGNGQIVERFGWP